MRKMNWLVGSLALIVGVVVGSVGFAMATGTVSDNPLLTKLRGDKEAKPVSAVYTPGTSTQSSGPYTGTDPGQTPAPDSGAELNPNLDNLNPLSPDEDTSHSSANDPLSQSNGNQNPSDKSKSQVDPKLAQQIIADYKQDIGLFFDAWKSKDMAAFRVKLSKAYTGDLYEKHARRAETYINQGVGLEVTKISFEGIVVESASGNAATLKANYRYIARDYNIVEGSVIGEDYQHEVNVRVNLITQNNKWLITGESSLSSL
ncbi:MAG: hypothetical protein M0T74_16890 [Desulfitobacterium hafniense]|nr:hypothetical protein [Desulfitobacterium hafniense]